MSGDLQYIRLAVLAAAIAVMAGATARAEILTPIETPDPAELGFKETQVLQSDGTWIMTYRDLKTGVVTKVFGSSENDSRTTESRGSNGRILMRSESGAVGSVFETFEPEYRKTEIRPLITGKVEITEERGIGKKKSVTRRIAGDEAFNDSDGSCPQPPALQVEYLQQILNQTGPVVALSSGADTTTAHLGFNVVAKGCQDLAPLDTPLVSGNAVIAQDLSRAMNQGVRCLAEGLFSPAMNKIYNGIPAAQIRRKQVAMRIKMAQLMAHFRDPDWHRDFTFKCVSSGTESGISSGTIARAVTCDSPSKVKAGVFPGVIINRDSYASKPAHERESTLFHEMLHHLGFTHNLNPGKLTVDQDRFDMCYQVEACCFDHEPLSCRALMTHEHGDPLDFTR